MRVVIIGSNHAGISCAMTLSSYYKDIEISVFEESNSIAYIGADGLLWISGEIDNIEKTLYSSPEKLRAKGIDLHLNSPVYKVDTVKKEVFYKEDSQNKSLIYDKLVLATGSSPIRTLNDEKSILANKTKVLTAKTFSEGKELFEISHDKKLKKMAIIGGGYIGAEAAVAFREARDDIVIDLYQKSDQILNNYFDKEFAQFGEEELINHKINVKLNLTINESDVEKLNYDLILESIGFCPNSELIPQLDRLEPTGAYKVNFYGQTSDNDIYAVGDCASVYNNILEKDVYMPLGSYATHSAIIAAHHIGFVAQGLIPRHKHNGSEGASSVKIFDIILSSVGMTYENAQNKFASNAQYIDFSNVIKPKYLTEKQGNAPITIRVVFKKDTLQLLGFQIACGQDVTNLIHLLSLVLQKQMTAYQIRYLDMFFLPELNQVYNYLQRALSQVLKFGIIK
ncbi:MAG: FAD-dependent oxidoreductase [Bifidobacteriaceae bacterium]|jgi:NADPH-dependent 2,4-dienoyl-CoA reductase/sulfur reductase-like enzyme|nr:FAD-dependent oxidoreductase [Bifidobacteriaceae bacterium]